jgi:uncharacterized DUF497 family protein
MQFEWDVNKYQINLKKHGIFFEEATTVWTDTLALIAPDPEHSLTEEREWIIGKSYKNRALIVVYTIRDDKIRIISARLATKSEKKQYEQEY